MSNCTNCGKETERGTKFCSPTCKCKYWQTNKRQQFKSETGLSYQSYKGIKRKLKYIEFFGGKCTSCGYNKNLSALEFHHIDPKSKEFEIDARSLANRSLKSIENEVVKCTLLCANCHQEFHNPSLNIENVKKIIQEN